MLKPAGDMTAGMQSLAGCSSLQVTWQLACRAWQDAQACRWHDSLV